MPNRILKESICSSEEIDVLTPEEEVFFYRLMVVCDDFGLMDARPKILKAKCFPLKSIDINCIQLYLDRLSETGLIYLYEVDGKPYLHISTWEKHQQIRAKRAKFPTPEQGNEITRKQVIADVTVIQSNPIQSESNPNLNQPDGVFFDEAWSLYPCRPGASKKDSRKAWDARIKASVDPNLLIDGVKRYAAYCAAMRLEPQFIKQPATFFGPGEHYLSDWTPSQGGNHAGNRESVVASFTGNTGRGQPATLEGTSYRVDSGG